MFRVEDPNPLKHLNLTAEELWHFIRKETEEGRSVRITVNSGSMRPFLRQGQEVILQAPPRPIRRGDVVLARTDDGRVLLHAVAGSDGGVLTLRGTANLYVKETCRIENVAAVLTNPSPLIRIWPFSAPLRWILLKLFN